jgi:acyl-ACP thioesterase
MIWSEIQAVNSHDCDKNRILRPTGIFRMVQEAAAHQLTAVGQDETDMHAAHRAYIVSQIGIDVIKPVYMNDSLTIKTWEANSVGAKFMRYYSVLRGDEEVVCGSCICALINTETGRFIRVSDSGYAFGGAGDERVPSLDSHGAMNKALTYKKAADFPVLYTFIDRNDHMNNTCYADMFFSAIPDCEKKYMTGISISYLRQAKLGDVLSLELADADGKYFIRAMCGETLVATAQIGAKEL